MDFANEEDVAISELSRLAENRARVYQLLSLIYITPPDQEILNGLLNVGMLQLSNTSELNDQLPEQMLKGLKVVHDFLEKHRAGSHEVSATNVLVEFTRLFRGLKHESPPPPYESVYLREGVVFGESTIEIYRRYCEFGLGLANQYKGEPPDYISFELDFMRFLCTKEAEAWHECDQNEALLYLTIEGHFLDEHLLRWVSKFCEDIRTYEKLGFYRGWADVTEGWVKFDYQHISGLIEDTSRSEEN